MTGYDNTISIKTQELDMKQNQITLAPEKLIQPLPCFECRKAKKIYKRYNGYNLYNIAMGV